MIDWLRGVRRFRKAAGPALDTLRYIIAKASDLNDYRERLAESARKGDLDAAYLAAKMSDARVRKWAKRR